MTVIPFPAAPRRGAPTLPVCYRCDREFAEWGPARICPACFARRPARLNGKWPLPAGKPSHAGEPSHAGKPTRRDATRLIDHGLRLWAQHPRAREVRWEDGRCEYRLSATNFRYLLHWRSTPRGAWQPGFCRWG